MAILFQHKGEGLAAAENGFKRATVVVLRLEQSESTVARREQ